MSTSRETARDALAALLEAALVGDGLPCKTVTSSKVENLKGLTPLVSVLSAGTLRERMTFMGDSATFSLEVQVWVLQSVTGWTNAQAEDALDRIESLIAGVYEDARGTASWEIVEYASATTISELSVAGIPFYMERIPTTVKLARS